MPKANSGLLKQIGRQIHPTRTYAYISLLILAYYVVYYLYIGITHPVPALGDSWDYHIPISQSILNGNFLTLEHAKAPQWYYPGASEAINSLFLLLHIPLTLSNLFAILVLFVVCFKLGLKFKLEYYMAVLFAAMICGLNVLVRWYNAVSIDVWVAVFFFLSIMLLEKPQKTHTYFAKLGFTFGMLIGSKYTACLYALLLMVVYWGKIFPNINFARLVTFFIPFSLFGLFWYIRNFALTSNPFYPLPLFGLPGKNLFQGYNIANITMSHPAQMLNAVFSEYNVWSIIVLFTAGFYFYKKFTGKKVPIYGINRLYIIGILCFFLFLTFPTSTQPWIMVSSMRYSFPLAITLILCTYLIASHYKKEEFVGITAIASMLMTLPMHYSPKLSLLYLPLGLFLIYCFEKYRKFTLNKHSL